MITGQVTALPESFKINGNDVQIGVESFFGTDPLEFHHSIVLESGFNKVDVDIVDKNGEVVLTGMINIHEEGQYQLRALVWDSFDFMNSLSDTIEYTVQP